MEKGNRAKTIFINSSVTLVSQILQITLGFITRKIFIDTLGVNYLGYNSVFSNVLQMLNLADLGIGIAVTSYLYKPLAQNDRPRIEALMYLYKKIYSILGVLVAAAGIVISFFIPMLISDATCSIEYLKIIYFISLSGTVSTYFLAYKRTLLIANQKSYIANLVDMIVFVISSIIQVIILYLGVDYIFYLIITTAKNIIANTILSIKSDHDYGKVGSIADYGLLQEYKPQIIQYVKDMFISKIGAYIYYGTDNIIISVFKGSVLTGYLSNYTLITSQINAVISHILSSVQATFGNFINSNDDINAQKTMTDYYLCINFCIGNFCMVCFMALAQPFVKLFFGRLMLLENSTVLWLAVNLMLTILIQLPSQIFVIYRLYRYDRPIIAVSAFLNIVVSVMLVRKIGMNGVLMGTFITSLFYLFSRLFIISHKVFKIKYIIYIKQILYYMLTSCISSSVTLFVCKDYLADNKLEFIVKALCVGCLALVTTTIPLSYTKNFWYLLDRFLPHKMRKKFNRLSLSIICMGSILLFYLLIRFLGDTKEMSYEETGNKSLARTDSYVDEECSQIRFFHLSFDDTIECFKDITENDYDSIFGNPTFLWFKELHETYGVVITCYCYYEELDENPFDLEECTRKYQSEFKANSNWLRFGFHALNGNTIYDGKQELPV